jgi:repressor LexA
MTSNQLTEKQAAILKFIAAHSRTYGFPPTNREICGQFNLKGTNTVAGHLRLLKNKGHITWEAGKSRTLVVVGAAVDGCDCWSCAAARLKNQKDGET